MLTNKNVVERFLVFLFVHLLEHERKDKYSGDECRVIGLYLYTGVDGRVFRVFTLKSRTGNGSQDNDPFFLSY